MNSVQLMGRLTRDPELTYNQGTGNAMCRFTLAVDKKLSREKKQEMESRNQPTADFINIVCWGRLAETVNQFTAKGKRCLIEGRIQTGSYTAQDGSKRYTTDIVANSVEFIDWKDRDSYGSEPARSNDSFPQNQVANQATNQRSNQAAQSQPSNDSEDDDFFGDDFSPVDDDRIPF